MSTNPCGTRPLSSREGPEAGIEGLDLHLWPGRRFGIFFFLGPLVLAELGSCCVAEGGFTGAEGDVIAARIERRIGVRLSRPHYRLGHVQPRAPCLVARLLFQGHGNTQFHWCPLPLTPETPAVTLKKIQHPPLFSANASAHAALAFSAKGPLRSPFSAPLRFTPRSP